MPRLELVCKSLSSGNAALIVQGPHSGHWHAMTWAWRLRPYSKQQLECSNAVRDIQGLGFHVVKVTVRLGGG